jgi:hypothetical protein
MRRKPTIKPQQTPFERFTEAAKHIFNIPQAEVKKIKAKSAHKSGKRASR